MERGCFSVLVISNGVSDTDITHTLHSLCVQYTSDNQNMFTHILPVQRVLKKLQKGEAPGSADILHDLIPYSRT